MHSALRWIRESGLAFAFTLAAGGTLLLMTRSNVIKFSDHLLLYQIAAWILIGAAVISLIPQLKPFAELLVWNGTGWSAGLAVLGLESVGAMPLWPIMLAALALTFWPRQEDRHVPASAIAVALIGGVLVCWLAWESPDLSFLGDYLEE